MKNSNKKRSIHYHCIPYGADTDDFFSWEKSASDAWYSAYSYDFSKKRLGFVD